jgi:hypothetical protein
MNRLLFFVLFPATFLHAMQPSYWQKYRERKYYKIEDGEVKISTQMFLGQVLANCALACTIGAVQI